MSQARRGGVLFGLRDLSKHHSLQLSFVRNNTELQCIVSTDTHTPFSAAKRPSLNGSFQRPFAAIPNLALTPDAP